MAIDVYIVFASAGIVAADHVLVIFIDQHRRCAEDDEVVVEGRDGIIEIRFVKHEPHQALAFSKPETDR